MPIASILLALAAAQAENVPPLISSKDYPEAARKAGVEGTVRALLQVGADGRVKACDVVVSSNSAALDATTCRIMVTRARFSPALDENGKPTEGEFLAPPIRWSLESRGNSGKLVASSEPPAAVAAPAGSVTKGRKVVCEAGAGMYEMIPVPAPFGEEVAANVRLIEAKPHPKWVPAAGIVFEVQGVKDRIAGIQMMLDPDKTKLLKVGIRRPSGTLTYFRTADSAAPVGVSTRLVRNILVVSSAGMMEAAKLNQAVGAPQIFCSSGKFEFEI